MNQEDNKQELDNPVKRLYEIIKLARSKGDSFAMRYIWADILGVDREDNIGLYQSVIDLINLSQSAKLMIQELDDVNRDHYLTPFSTIEKILRNMNLESQWSQHKVQLTDALMLALQLAANTVSTQYGEKIIDQDKLKELKGIVDDLFEKVLNTKFESQNLKKVILEHLEQIRRAITSYRVSGSDGLRRAVDGTIGALLSREEEINSEFEKDKTISNIFKEIIGVIANITQIASFEIQLAILTSNLPNLLSSGG